MKIKNLELTKMIEKSSFLCKEIGLDLIGLMCIPPANIDPENILKR